MCSNYPSAWPLQQMCEGLLEYTKAMNLDPLIASGYNISDEGLTYTFYIHKKMFTSMMMNVFPAEKEVEVKAQDFKYCFQRLCDPRTKTRGLWLFRDKVKGATEYINSIKDNKLDVRSYRNPGAR